MPGSRLPPCRAPGPDRDATTPSGITAASAAASDIAWGDEPCAGWRATDADGYFGPWNHRTAHPILLVGTYDPATPDQDSVAMSRELADARLLTMDGYGHTALDNPGQMPLGNCSGNR